MSQLILYISIDYTRGVCLHDVVYYNIYFFEITAADTAHPRTTSSFSTEDETVSSFLLVFIETTPRGGCGHENEKHEKLKLVFPKDALVAIIAVAGA